MKNSKLFKLVLSAVALAMGVASFVLLVLGEPKDTVITLLVIAALCQGFLGLDNLEKFAK